jgi:hypothetical protein
MCNVFASRFDGCAKSRFKMVYRRAEKKMEYLMQRWRFQDVSVYGIEA